MSGNVYTSPDFQCDQTEGFPTSLYADWDEGIAWLELNESLIDPCEDVSYYQSLCDAWGKRPCVSAEDFNNLLKELGNEALYNAEIPVEDDTEEMQL
ncbi:MAG: hypothetical protein PHV32_18380 [Eubacteriales bacterium]|nr:hypothetical protein [Eubacteriales bacterium]MDD4496277.1 hypothetical protein [Eubacteriales bacterium]